MLGPRGDDITGPSVDRERVVKVFDKYTGFSSKGALQKEGEAGVSIFKEHIEATNKKKLNED